MRLTLGITLAGCLLLLPLLGCKDDEEPTDDDDTTAPGDDDTTAGDDDTTAGDDDDSAVGDDDDSAAEEVATPEGGMPVGTEGIQVGLRAQADLNGETLVSDPVEVTLVEPTAAPQPPPPGDATAIQNIRQRVLEVSP